MLVRTICLVSFTCFLLTSCGGNAAETPKNTATIEEIKEIERLDSLNQEIEKSTKEIEESIESVENAVGELDDL